MGFMSPKQSSPSIVPGIARHMLQAHGIGPASSAPQNIPSTIIRKNSLVNPTQSPQVPPGSLINRAKYQSNY